MHESGYLLLIGLLLLLLEVLVLLLELLTFWRGVFSHFWLGGLELILGAGLEFARAGGRGREG